MQAHLDVVQLLRGLMQVCVRRQVQGRFQIPVPDGRHLVRQQADIPDQGPVPPDPEDFQDPYQRKGGNKNADHSQRRVPKHFIHRDTAENSCKHNGPQCKVPHQRPPPEPLLHRQLQVSCQECVFQPPQQTPPLLPFRVFPGDVPQPQRPHQRQQRRGIGGQQRRQPQGVRHGRTHPAVIPEFKGRVAAESCGEHHGEDCQGSRQPPDLPGHAASESGQLFLRPPPFRPQEVGGDQAYGSSCAQHRPQQVESLHLPNVLI